MDANPSRPCHSLSPLIHHVLRHSLDGRCQRGSHPLPRYAAVSVARTTALTRSHPVRAPEDKASLWSREVYEGFHPTFTYPVRPPVLPLSFAA